jgi:hypothetical protein
MNLYLVEAFDGEQGYFVIANSDKEAIDLAKKHYFSENGTVLPSVEVSEEAKIRKGVVGGIDWTEPEPPIFEYYK